MSILQRIKADQVAARRGRHTALATILTTLYAEVANVGLNDGKRETTDEEAIAVLKKFVKNLDEVLANDMDDEQLLRYTSEQAVYMEYLPQQMTEDELRCAIELIVNEERQSGEVGPKQMGAVMGQLKKEHGGNYDGKLASQLVKQALAS